MWTAALLALALQGVDSTARDSAAVRRIAAVALKTDSATIAAAQLRFSADTVWVHVSDGSISAIAVRLVRRNKEWVDTGERIYWIH